MIASNDGGVHEFIQNKKTGILIKDPFDVQNYIDSLKEAQKDRAVLVKYVNNAQKLLKKRHSFTSFTKEMKKDFKN